MNGHNKELVEELRTKTTMNRMSEGPGAQSHRTNAEVLELFAEIDSLLSGIHKAMGTFGDIVTTCDPDQRAVSLAQRGLKQLNEVLGKETE